MSLTNGASYFQIAYPPEIRVNESTTNKRMSGVIRLFVAHSLRRFLNHFASTIGSLCARRFAVAGAAVLLMLPSIQNIVRYDFCLTQPDTRAQYAYLQILFTKLLYFDVMAFYGVTFTLALGFWSTHHLAFYPAPTNGYKIAR